MPAVLTIRLSKEEHAILARRSKRAGMSKAEFVRKLICAEEDNSDLVPPVQHVASEWGKLDKRTFRTWTSRRQNQVSA